MRKGREDQREGEGLARVWSGMESDGRIITWIREGSPAPVDISHMDKVKTAIWLLIIRDFFME